MKRFLAITLVLLLAACQVQTAQPPVASGEQSFASADDLLSFIKEHDNGGGYYYGGGDVLMARNAVAESEDSVAVGAPMPAKMDSDGGFSGTNVQVAGIDEADIVKSDGEYLYIVQGTTLFIVDAVPGRDASIVSSLDLEQYAQGMFIDGDRLAVFGSFSDNAYFKAHDLRPSWGMTYFTILDISDRSDPLVAKEFKLEGQYLDARMNGDWVYFVARSAPEIRPLPMPYMLEDDVLSHVAIDQVYRYPVPYDQVEFATIHAIRLTDGRANAATVMVEGGETLYMSDDNAYLASTEYVNEWEIRQDVTMDLLNPELSAAERVRIRKIKAADADILSASEKEQKVWQVYSEYMQYLPDDEQSSLAKRVDSAVRDALEKYTSLEYTVIHRIAVDGADISLESTGEVPGRLYGQFAMDEHENVLRVATTWRENRWMDDAIMEETMMADGAAGMPEPAMDAKMIAPPRPRSSGVSNAIYTLDMDLEVLDSLTGIADGEQIFSARFAGDRLYLVTYRQVDPFFVFDLSDPRDITSLGELKIPGFSRYLHPYDADHIIGIGRDATDLGRQQGIKISLFDVSDVTKPKEVASWIANEQYSQSSAEWEHKAFLFSREKNLLVIPAYSYDYNRGRTQSYNGAMVFHIDESDISLRGIIDHSRAEQYYGATMQRSGYIGDELWTLSEGLLRINALSDLHSVVNVTLTAKDQGPYPVY